MNRRATEVLEAIDAEEERQKEALRRFLERERTYKVPLDRGKLFAWFLLVAGVTTIVLILVASR